MRFSIRSQRRMPCVALIPPQDAALREWLNGELSRARVRSEHIASEEECRKYLLGDQTSAYVIAGRHRWRGLIGSRNELRQVLGNKIVYRVGPASLMEARALLREGLAAFIGYDGCPDAYAESPRLPEFLGSSLVAALRALSVGCNVSGVTAAIRKSWVSILMKIHDSMSYPDGDALSFMFAQSNLDRLFFLGDAAWSMRARPRLLVLDGLVTLGEHRNHEPKHPNEDEPTRRFADEFSARKLLARVEIVDISPFALDLLKAEPTRLSELSPKQFEDFVADRLRAMNFTVLNISPTNQRDGGIDLLAVPNLAPVPYVLAVQVKHSKAGRHVGPAVVRELRGVIATQPLCIGLIVTNTSFTPDAAWTAQQMPTLIRLRDFETLKKWLNDEFSGEDVYDELPRTIQLAPGLTVSIPRAIDP